jgi:hypothetical protein
MEVTAHPRCAAALQMRLPGDGVLAVFCVDVGFAGDGVPRNPLPPQTTSFFFAAEAMIV